jgi:hypothetical protein
LCAAVQVPLSEVLRAAEVDRPSFVVGSVDAACVARVRMMLSSFISSLDDAQTVDNGAEGGANSTLSADRRESQAMRQ